MGPKKPTVVLNRALLPMQLSGTVDIGPAYSTFDDAFRNKAHPKCHIAEVLLFDEFHREIAHWWELSQSVGVKGVGRAGDTEQKALVRVNLKPGYTLEIRGAYNPCTFKSGCDIAMQRLPRKPVRKSFIARTRGKEGLYTITQRTISNGLDREHTFTGFVPTDKAKEEFHFRCIATLRVRASRVSTVE